MRNILRLCGLLLGLGLLSVPVAYSATVTRLVISGTTANLNLVTSLPGSRPDCTIDVWVVLTASASVQRSTMATATTGALGFVQRVDNCIDEFEFGSFSVTLPSSAFSSTSSSAALNATIPVVMSSFGPAGGTVNRTLVATLRYTNLENNSVASRSFGMVRAPSFTLVTRSRSVFNAAGVTGGLTLDGRNLVTGQASIDSGIETGTSATVDITR